MSLDPIQAAQAPQQQASDPGVNVFVTANAGSGKTKTLIDRVARLLLKDVEPERILCITYTKAAAAEMQRRLFDRLGGWSVEGDDRLRRDLEALTGEPQDAIGLSKARRLFAKALETPGGLKIQTIHAFCEQLLRRFPMEAGVSPRFKVMDDAEAALIGAQARADVAELSLAGQPQVQAAYERLSLALDHESFETMFSDIAARRFALGRHVEACRGDVAGAVWREIDPDRGPYDAAQVEAEARAGFDPALWRAIMTCLLAGAKTDQERGQSVAAWLEAGAVPPVTALCRLLFTGGGEGTPATWPAKSACFKASEPLRDRLLEEQARLGEARGRLRAVTTAEDTIAVLMLAGAFSAAYESRKASRGALDFADLIERALKLVAEREDAAWVLYKLDGGIDHVLVDEAQDTAPEQWDLVERLTGDFFSGRGAAEEADAQVARSLFVVGDVKQSIFSFQGAQARRVLEESHAYHLRARAAGRDFAAPALEHSWRSVPEVLRLVDTVFEPEETRQGVPPPEGLDRVLHLPTRSDHQGSAELWPLIRDEASPPRRAWSSPVDLEREDTANQRLARAIAGEIEALIARGDAVFDKDRRVWRAAAPGDVLILVRRRGVLFSDILRELKRRGVPVAGADRLKLSEHILSDDLLALGRFILWPEDDLTLAALLKSPFFGLDDDDLYDLGHGRGGRSLWSRLRRKAGEGPIWAEARERLSKLMEAATTAAPYDLYAGFLASTDAAGRSMRSRMLTRLGSEATDAADAFLAEVLACEDRGAGSLQAVIDLMGKADIEVKREMDAPRDEVRVMTVHGAKGLEAPILFLPETTTRGLGGRGSPLLTTESGGFLWAGSDAQDCPASARARARRAEREAEEALRLLYVALTRARDRLIVCGRLDARSDPDKVEGWYGAARRAFAALGATDIGDGRLRFGPAAAPAERASALGRAETAPPDWLGASVPSEARRGWASPSALAGRPRTAATPPLARRGGLGRFRRGELIHKLFELLPDIAPAERGPAAAAYLARQPDLDEAQRDEIAGAVLAVLDDPAFAALFGEGSRAEASAAGWGPGLPEGMRIAGRLDRLVVSDDRVLVCDFKTNRPAPPTVEESDPAYVAQLAAYVAVLAGLWPDRPVRAALLWTDGPRLDLIPEAMIEDALATLRGG